MQFQENNMIQTQENGEKPHFGPDLSPLSPNSCHLPPPPQKNMASSVTRYHDQLSACKISTDPFSRKLSDGQMDRQTDRWTRVILWDAVRLTSSVQ